MNESNIARSPTIYYATNFFVSPITIFSHNVKVIKYGSYSGPPIYILIGNPHLVVSALCFCFKNSIATSLFSVRLKEFIV